MSFSMIMWKQKNAKKVKLGYIDTESFIVHIKMENIYLHIAKDIENRFETSNYELERQLTKITNIQVLGLREDEYFN